MRMTKVIGLVAGLTFCSAALAQNSGNSNAGQPNQADQMHAWEQANKVGESQTALAIHMVGEWKSVSTFWMTPDAPAQTSEGTAKFSSIMGGRFVEQDFEGNMFGKTFKGRAWFGFNNASRQFENVWIDSESTGLLFMSGTKDSAGTINWSGPMIDPNSGQKVTIKAKTSWRDKNTMVYEMFENTSDGKEFRTLEVVYTRNAPAARPVNEAKPVATPAQPAKREPNNKPATKDALKPRPENEPGKNNPANDPR